MRFYKGLPPTATHVQVSEWADVPRLESLGVPLAQYTECGTYAEFRLPVWAPRWAMQLIDDWPEADPFLSGINDVVLRRVIERVLLTGDAQLAQAAAAVARMSGAKAVEEMLWATASA